jgi:hypothetical protein
MFLRRFERRKNGKPHTYWALAESYRTAKGSRQRIVAYLGELTRAEQDGWAKLGQHLATKSSAAKSSAAKSPDANSPDANSAPKPLQRTLFDPPRRDEPQEDEPQEDEPLLVKLSGIRLERTRDFGDVWLAWGLWRCIGLVVTEDGFPIGYEVFAGNTNDSKTVRAIVGPKNWRCTRNSPRGWKPVCRRWPPRPKRDD